LTYVFTVLTFALTVALTVALGERPASAQAAWLTDQPPEASAGEMERQAERVDAYLDTEVDASAHTGASIAPGQQRQSRIDFPGDADWFSARLTGGKRYQIDLIGGGPAGPPLPDPYLEMFDENSVGIVSDDDGGADKNARLLYRPDTDRTVYLAAKGYSDNTGAYTLSINELLAPERITLGQSVTGVITNQRPTVQYVVSLEAGQSYVLTQVGLPGGGGTLSDPLLRLLDGNLTKVAENDDHEGSRDSQIIYQADRSDDYLVEAAAIGNNVGSYTLTVDVFELPENEVGDTPETAGVLTPGSPVQDRIDIPEDKDWFAVDLVAGTSYVFRMHGAPSGEGTLTDSYLQLLTEDGQEVASNDDYEGTTNSRIEFTASETGRHFVVAGGLGENTGTYTLTMEGEGVTAVTTGDIRIVVELTDGQQIILRLQRAFLQEVNTISIGPDLADAPAEAE